jgi:dihydroorotate dehydrogenase (NAD+) catalytic subunit
VISDWGKTLSPITYHVSLYPMPKYDLSLQPPLMSAAGSLGFAPDPYGRVDLRSLGAFITNPVSRLPRAPAQERRCVPYSGGFLLHTGWPNPGLKTVIRRFSARWGRSPVPVWVHLIALHPDEVYEMVGRLERVEGVMGVEVGLPPEADVGQAIDFARAAVGELPVLLRLPFERAAELAGALKTVPAGADLAAVSLAPPRGALYALPGNRTHGRLYGPGIFPFVLPVVASIAKAGIPVVAAGGVYRRSEVQALLSAGAIAVQLDSVLWRGGLLEAGE